MRLALPAFLVWAMLLLLQSGSAVGSDDEGESSSTASRRGYSRASTLPPNYSFTHWPLQEHERFPEGWRPLPAPVVDENGKLNPAPPLNRYFEWLRISKINALEESDPSQRDPEIPFYKGSPLFAVHTHPDVVEQALRDYDYVGIVDPNYHKLVWIGKDTRSVTQRPDGMGEEADIVALYNLPSKVHKLKKALNNQIERVPQPRSVDHFPHALGKPILADNAATLEHMLAASRQDYKGFWIVQGRSRRYILIRPWTDLMFAVTRPDEAKRVSEGYKEDKDKYGEGFASLRWGRPLDQPLTEQRRSSDIPSLDANRATREQMIEALHTYGRFHLYTGRSGGSEGNYKVTLNQASSTRSGESVTIEPLETGTIRRLWSNMSSFKIRE